MFFMQVAVGNYYLQLALLLDSLWSVFVLLKKFCQTAPHANPVPKMLEI